MATGLKVVFLVPAFPLYDCGRKPCPNLLVRLQRRIVRRLLSFYTWERLKRPAPERFLSRRLIFIQLR